MMMIECGPTVSYCTECLPGPILGYFLLQAVTQGVRRVYCQLVVTA